MTANSIIAAMLVYLSPIIGDAEIDVKQVRCMADNAYFESALESRIGKRQVVYAVMDRVASKHYPNTPCKVIWQKARDKRSGKVVSQFSWTWDGRVDKIKFTNKKGAVRPSIYRNYAMAVEEAVFVMLGLKGRPCEKTTTHYWSHIALKKPPYWHRDFDVACRIGGHTFMTKKSAKDRSVAVATKD